MSDDEKEKPQGYLFGKIPYYENPYERPENQTPAAFAGLVIPIVLMVAGVTLAKYWF